MNTRSCTKAPPTQKVNNNEEHSLNVINTLVRAIKSIVPVFRANSDHTFYQAVCLSTIFDRLYLGKCPLG